MWRAGGIQFNHMARESLLSLADGKAEVSFPHPTRPHQPPSFLITHVLSATRLALSLRSPPNLVLGTCAGPVEPAARVRSVVQVFFSLLVTDDPDQLNPANCQEASRVTVRCHQHRAPGI
jgi:hypothetical protein